jgi:uncharacterized protein (DUF433 family)
VAESNYQEIIIQCNKGNIMPYQQRITIESGTRGGKPCIRGMRITVYDVLEYLASGMSFQEILDDFPYLTKEDILASLSFAALRERSMIAISSGFHATASV